MTIETRTHKTTDGRWEAYAQLGRSEKRHNTLPRGADAVDAKVRSLQMLADMHKKAAAQLEWQIKMMTGNLTEPERARVAQCEQWNSAFERQTEILASDPDGQDESLDREYEECERVLGL